MTHVNIVLSDRGWILEKLATEIGKRLPYVKFGTTTDPTAAIQYYITYSTWRERVSPVEVAYFAHLELDPLTRKKFFDVAEAVDYCTCHSEMYEAVLREQGIQHVATISPGVDLEQLRPVVKVGVVGRTYHTGRKGEALVRDVMDSPGIEWHFTGEGWPGPARRIPEGEMAKFYNEMDYVLVPALYEGGPMCVVEALACGCPVIAPPIGWVNQFPHIEYRTGDAADLRRVLEDVVRKKEELRASVLNRTWDAWAENHDRLFQRLVGEYGLRSTKNTVPRNNIGRVALALHGNEGTTLGGPSIRVPKTVRHLRQIGYEASTVNFPAKAIQSAGLVHGFNVWSPHSGIQMARSVVAQGKPFVLSTIYLDLSERAFWQDQLPVLFERTSRDRIDGELSSLWARFTRDFQRKRLPIQGSPDHHQIVREMVDLADHVILLSETERRALERIGAVPNEATIVHNAVDPERFGDANPTLFSEAYGLKDYVLCVGRLEPRKNQLALLHALRDMDVPVVLIGHSTNRVYERLIEGYRKSNVHIIGRISPDDPLLASAIAGARVFTLPSWSEGAPLAALEAAASGATMVLSNRSSEAEYFGEFASYCDPADPNSIRDAIALAYDNPLSATSKAELKRYVGEHYSWDKYARRTADVYEAVAKARATPVSVPDTDWSTRKVTSIAIDVTTSCNHRGRWTGISRSEMSLAYAIKQNPEVKLVLVAWHSQLGRFIEIPHSAFHKDYLSHYFGRVSSDTLRSAILDEGTDLIVCGSAWMQNRTYTDMLVEFCNAQGLSLNLVVHDIIPTKFPFWFDEKYSPTFERNLNLLLSAAARIFAVSRHTAKDVFDFAVNRGVPIGAPNIYYQGSDIGMSPGEIAQPINSSVIDKFRESKFVLNVGAIHSRKNHRLLYDLWINLIEQLGERCPHLLIVGGVGWNGKDVGRAFREDKRVAKFVHILEDIDDATLSWLYEQCIFTVYPSLYEGWGLPVAESLAHGKICLASDVSSIPEIASDLTDLIDPQDIRSWQGRIAMYVTSPALRSAREAEIGSRYRPLTWNEAAKQLVSQMENVPTFIGWPPCAIGKKIQFNTDQAVSVKFGGWYGNENWGVWSSEKTARLRMRLDQLPTENLVLVFRAQALGSGNEPVHCDVQVNGHDIGRMSFYGKGAEYHTLRLPSNVFAGQLCLSVVLNNSALLPCRLIDPNSSDLREFGVGLIEMLVETESRFSIAELNAGEEAHRAAFFVDQRIWLLGRSDISRLFARNVVLDEAWGVRSSEGPLNLLVRTHEDLDCDLTISITFRVCASDTSPVNVLVSDGQGEVIGRINASNDAIQTARFHLSRRLRTFGSPLLLSFNCDVVHSPAQLNLGPSKNPTSFGLFELALESGIRPVRGYMEDEEVRLIPQDGTITFAATDGETESPGRAYLDVSTWHSQEPGGVWSRGELGRLAFKLERRPRNDISLDLYGILFVPIEEGNWIEVSVNGVKQAVTMEARDHQFLIRVAIPVDCLDPLSEDNLVLRIEMNVAMARKPAIGGNSLDERLLGFYLTSATMPPQPREELSDKTSNVSYLHFGQKVYFGTDVGIGGADGGVYLLDTWYPAEQRGVWSRGPVGRFAFKLRQSVQRNLVLELEVCPFVPFDAGNEVAVKVNGYLCTTTVTAKGEFLLVRVHVRSDYAVELAGDEVFFLVTLMTSVSDSPASCSENIDRRVLGTHLCTAVLREDDEL